MINNNMSGELFLIKLTQTPDRKYFNLNTAHPENYQSKTFFKIIIHIAFSRIGLISCDAVCFNVIEAADLL